MKLLYSNNGLTNKRPLMLQGPESSNPKRQCTTGVNMDNPGTSQQQQQSSYNIRVSICFGMYKYKCLSVESSNYLIN